ncbi:hypothetical protein E2C01_053606 [Portunus trituberculatus]|uniref:Uncharacterized protein n=1 Tax=Portunus trituberculatus TaxID=210409 RepID=A0A5B7GKS2_PORTR|nr:hypothetical protein [Portunus trituberculatus]
MHERKAVLVRLGCECGLEVSPGKGEDSRRVVARSGQPQGRSTLGSGHARLSWRHQQAHTHNMTRLAAVCGCHETRRGGRAGVTVIATMKVLIRFPPSGIKRYNGVQAVLESWFILFIY